MEDQVTTDNKTTLVVFGYSDGSFDYAVGDHAQEVATHINAAQSMLYIHGSQYSSRKMIPVHAPDSNELEPIKPIAERTFPEWVEELRKAQQE